MKPLIVLLLAGIVGPSVCFAGEVAEAASNTGSYDPVIIGAVVGAFVGIFSSYVGPMLLELTKHWIQYRPRKKLLKKMLSNPDYKGRTLHTLSMVTGTDKDLCRRLLIEVGARGFTMKKGEEKQEGWVFIKDRPLKEE